MICPHCRKAINTAVGEKLIAKARKLRAQGYSLRDIERALDNRVSAATLSRRLKA